MVAGKLDTRLSVETLQTRSIWFYFLNVLPLYLNLLLLFSVFTGQMSSSDFWVYTSKGQMSEPTSFVSFVLLKEQQLYSNYSVMKDYDDGN